MKEIGICTRRLLRIGHDECVGIARGGFEAWQNEGRPVARLETITTDSLRAAIQSDAVEVVDVRTPDEWLSGTIDGARTLFLGDLEQRLAELPRDRPLVTMCSVGHRGSVAASLLARHGFDHVRNYLGGYDAWQAVHRGSSSR